MQTLDRYTEGQREFLFNSLRTQHATGAQMTTAERELFISLKEYYTPEKKARKTVLNKLAHDSDKLHDIWTSMEALKNEHGDIHPKKQIDYDKLSKAYERLDESVIRYMHRRGVTESEFNQSLITYHWEGYEFDEVLDAYPHLKPKDN